MGQDLTFATLDRTSLEAIVAAQLAYFITPANPKSVPKPTNQSGEKLALLLGCYMAAKFNKTFPIDERRKSVETNQLGFPDSEIPNSYILFSFVTNMPLFYWNF